MNKPRGNPEGLQNINSTAVESRSCTLYCAYTSSQEMFSETTECFRFSASLCDQTLNALDRDSSMPINSDSLWQHYPLFLTEVAIFSPLSWGFSLYHLPWLQSHLPLLWSGCHYRQASPCPAKVTLIFSLQCSGWA